MPKIVTVTLAGFDDDGDPIGSTCSSRCLVDNEKENAELIGEAREDAREQYAENIGNIPDRYRMTTVFVEYPVPNIKETVIKAFLPQEAEEPPVVATVS